MGLSDYLSDYLGATLEAKLGYDIPTAYDQIVTATLEKCEALSESDVANDKLNTVGKWQLWDRINRDLMFDFFDVSTDGSSYKRSQIMDYVKIELQKAYRDAKQYLNLVTVVNHPITTLTGDSYADRFH